MNQIEKRLQDLKTRIQKVEVYKEKYEELKKEFTRQVERISDLKAKEKITVIEEECNKTMGVLTERLKALEAEIQPLRDLDQAVTRLVGLIGLPSTSRQPGFEPGSQTVELQPTQTILVTEPDIKHAKVSDSTIRGKLLTLAKTGFFGKWQGLGDVHNGLIEKFGWTISKTSLDIALGRMVKDFLLGVKKHPSRKQKVYRLSANVKFKEA